MEVKYLNHIYLLHSLLVLFSLQLQAIAAINRGPYLSDVAKTSIVISWETTESGESMVEYSTEIQYLVSKGLYDKRVYDSTNVKRHSITLTKLMPSTWYHYRVVSGASLGEDNTFHTAVENDEPFTVVIYGDTRTNDDDHLTVVNRIREYDPDLVLHVGDLVEDGRDLSQWDNFFNITYPLMKRPEIRGIGPEKPSRAMNVSPLTCQ